MTHTIIKNTRPGDVMKFIVKDRNLSFVLTKVAQEKFEALGVLNTALVSVQISDEPITGYDEKLTENTQRHHYFAYYTSSDDQSIPICKQVIEELFGRVPQEIYIKNLTILS